MARRVPPLATLAHRRLFHFSLLLPLLLILSLLLCFSAPAHASHFRFVSFRWRPDPSNQRTAIITMTLAFRRSYFSPAPQINNTIDFSPSNNDVRVGYSTTRCPNRLAKVSVINTAEDWVLGEFTCSYTYPGTSLGPFRATWSGNARIDSLKNAGGANWDFYTDIVLGMKLGVWERWPRGGEGKKESLHGV